MFRRKFQLNDPGGAYSTGVQFAATAACVMFSCADRVERDTRATGGTKQHLTTATFGTDPSVMSHCSET
jgi:hypothetical protein